MIFFPVIRFWTSRCIFCWQIKLDFTGDNDDDYKATAGGNDLVLPSQKRHTKFKKVATVSKILSKKQRKKLEKIVEKKKKKEQVNSDKEY